MGLNEIKKLKRAAADKPKGVPGKFKSKKRTKKYAKGMRTLAINYVPYLEEHPFCVIRSPVCTNLSACVNHTAGRGVNEVLDQKKWEASCVPCNNYIEAHDAWAREHGHKVSRLAKS